MNKLTQTTATANSWQRVLPLLDSRFHVIAVDQLGFGLSDKPNKASYSTSMFAANLHTFIAGNL
jgi:pimeloyl-ACP methyl ester carboxylesterase